MPPAIPRATYRIQLTADFGFDKAAAIVPYLKALGITHLYASPFLKARKGSTHGYDIVDHTQFNPELGGEAAFERLSAALRAHDLGLILDFVPNHVGVHFADNPWWLDVLEWGPSSPHAAAFDIEWDTLPYRARGGVLLPILGTSYGEALENGEIELRYDATEGSFSAWYYEHRLPLAPERYGDILRTIVRHADADSDPAALEMLGLVARCKGLRRPNYTEAPAFKAALAAVPGGADVIARGLEAYRAGKERPTSTKALHLLLERQNFRLGHWRLASSEINYRRFFDVNTLAGLRVEDAGTFDAIHGLVKRLIAEDKLQGLRLDHIDGLRDPAQYFQRLRRLVRDAQGSHAKPFYVLIEKILGEGEALTPFVGVHGTTGYEWLNVISQVLVHGEGLAEIDEIWRQASNLTPKFTPVLREAKRRVLETLLLSEFTVLTRLLTRIANGHYSTRDFSADTLRQALELYVLHFPVYRTYLTAAGASTHDRRLIAETIEKARADWFGADEGIFDFLGDALTMDLATSGRGASSKPRLRRFALKVQQFTGPSMAKALEDTAFYRYHRLLALNEVGGDPAALAMPITAFHAAMQRRVKETPHGLTATATHDTKRGEDARARILALAEIPGEWGNLVGRWKLMNAPHVVTSGEMRSPSAPFEYMLYQALVGAWPLVHDADFTARMQAYALKAAREGKQETSWLNPNVAYEAGLNDFLAKILDPAQSPDFVVSMEAFVARVALLGALNSLGQVALKATMPGVPDFYQGTENWDLSLVDPDNRRPVDFAVRAGELGAQETPDWGMLKTNWRDGHIKLALTRMLLKLRADHEDVFTNGDYVPLDITGVHGDRVIAFARRYKERAAIVLVGKSFASATQNGRFWPGASDWKGAVEVSGYRLESVSNGQLDLARAFADLPVTVIPAHVNP
jgi:(1->4)-alpha-D-glucan 1-alpha-D-glucosylmutase